MFKITKDWLYKHRTENNAYTKAQLEILGFDAWPPLKGWKKTIIGVCISDKTRIKFEKAAKSDCETTFVRSSVKDISSKIRLREINNAELSNILNALKYMGHI